VNSIKIPVYVSRVSARARGKPKMLLSKPLALASEQGAANTKQVARSQISKK
jgi:hypothetical protein